MCVREDWWSTEHENSIKKKFPIPGLYFMTIILHRLNYRAKPIVSHRTESKYTESTMKLTFYYKVCFCLDLNFKSRNMQQILLKSWKLNALKAVKESRGERIPLGGYYRLLNCKMMIFSLLKLEIPSYNKTTWVVMVTKDN